MVTIAVAVGSTWMVVARRLGASRTLLLGGPAGGVGKLCESTPSYPGRPARHSPFGQAERWRRRNLTGSSPMSILCISVM